jgi:hypothetical protein
VWGRATCRSLTDRNSAVSHARESWFARSAAPAGECEVDLPIAYDESQRA